MGAWMPYPRRVARSAGRAWRGARDARGRARSDASGRATVAHVVIVGEAGMGKSRLLAAVEAAARDAGLCLDVDRERLLRPRRAVPLRPPVRPGRRRRARRRFGHARASPPLHRRPSPETARRFGGVDRGDRPRRRVLRLGGRGGRHARRDPAEVDRDAGRGRRALRRSAARIDRAARRSSSTTCTGSIHRATAMVELVVERPRRPPGDRPRGDPTRATPGLGDTRPDATRLDCRAWPNPRPPGWRRSSRGRRSTPKASAASTSGPAATRCSSARPSARSSRTARSSGGTAGSR